MMTVLVSQFRAKLRDFTNFVIIGILLNVVISCIFLYYKLIIGSVLIPIPAGKLS